MRSQRQPSLSLARSFALWMVNIFHLPKSYAAAVNTTRCQETPVPLSSTECLGMRNFKKIASAGLEKIRVT
ncbi:unnamed protein product [Musa banksii]